MFERIRPLRDPVHVELDGRRIPAERGEPLALTLIASLGSVTLARSPKLHRPRGPSCLRGDCDGCLSRVDGEPNVMTCQRDVRGGEQLHTQNVLGTRGTDLLRLTDWLFPQGIDHHHLFAGVPVASDLVASFARKLAGTGKLPERAAAPSAAERRSVEVLVVGAGLAGTTLASRVARAGRQVVLVDEGPHHGGSARFGGESLRSRLASIPIDGVEHLRRTTVAGVFESDALLVDGQRASLIEAKALVLATGAHDGAWLVPGGDLPGVFGARAVAQLAASGIVPRGGAVLVGEGPFGAELSELLGERLTHRVALDDVEEVLGVSQVRALRLRSGRARFRGHGFALEVDDDGLAAEGLWAVGECTGAPFDPDQLEAAAARAGEAVLRYLSAGGDRARSLRSGPQPSSTLSNSPSPPATNTAPKTPISAK